MKGLNFIRSEKWKLKMNRYHFMMVRYIRLIVLSKIRIQVEPG